MECTKKSLKKTYVDKLNHQSLFLKFINARFSVTKAAVQKTNKMIPCPLDGTEGN